MHNRRKEKLPLWVGWVGDMPAMNSYLHSKSWFSPWFLVKTINSIIRAIGVVAFANNPMTGTLILIAMFMGNLHVAFACIACGSLAVLTSLMLSADTVLLRDGVCVFNSILTGCILTAVLPGLDVTISLSYWGIIALAAIICCYVDQGLNTAMESCKLPGQSLPFNITAALFFMAFKTYYASTPVYTDIVGVETLNQTAPEWSKVLEGSVLAAGQIYGVGTIDSSILVWLGFLVYSPLLTLHFYIGSVIGCFGGALINASSYTEVYLGLWGYNSLLASGGVSFFVIPSIHSVFASIAAAVLAVVSQAACAPIFSVNMVPVYSYPFNVAIFLVLAISTREGSTLTFIKDRTFPELHIYKHYFLKEEIKDENGEA